MRELGCHCLCRQKWAIGRQRAWYHDFSKQELTDSVLVRYVEEEDLLALALGGRFVQHPAPLLCQEQPASG